MKARKPQARVPGLVSSPLLAQGPGRSRPASPAGPPGALAHRSRQRTPAQARTEPGRQPIGCGGSATSQGTLWHVLVLVVCVCGGSIGVTAGGVDGGKGGAGGGGYGADVVLEVVQVVRVVVLMVVQVMVQVVVVVVVLLLLLAVVLVVVLVMVLMVLVLDVLVLLLEVLIMSC